MVPTNLALADEAFQLCTVIAYHSVTSFTAEMAAVVRRSRGTGLSAAPSAQYRFYLFLHASKGVNDSSSGNVQRFLLNNGDGGGSWGMDSGDSGSASGGWLLGGRRGVGTLQNPFGSFEDLVYLIGVFGVMVGKGDF